MARAHRAVSGRAVAMAAVLGLAAGISLAHSAHAATPAPVRAAYQVQFLGAPVAEVGLVIEPDDEAMRSALAIRAVGLVDSWTRYRATMHSRLVRLDDGSYAPEAFTARYSKKKSDKVAQVSFDPQTSDVLAFESRKRGELQKPEVSAEDVRDVVDPLTALIQVRALIAENPDASRVRKRIFDGRSRYDIDAKLMKRSTIELNGASYPAVHYRLDMRPVAGMEGSDAADATGGKQGRWIEIILSDDDRLRPLRLILRGDILSASINYVGECPADSELCKL